jgi:antitoxin component YwqK of YwqJK toxin-antitoxin module
LSTTGAFAADKEESEWVYFYEAGQFWKKGSLQTRNVKDGMWTTWYESGQKLQEGPYVNGKEEGEWHSWFETGQQKTIGTFAEGRMNGLWRGFFPDGQPDFEGYYANDLKHGAWKLYTESPPGKDIGGRVKEEGSYTEGKKSGRWVTYNINGIAVAEGSYVKGTPTGAVGLLRRCRCEDCANKASSTATPKALCTVYDQRGRIIQQMNYRNGRLHGKMTVYSTDGKAP